MIKLIMKRLRIIKLFLIILLGFNVMLNAQSDNNDGLKLTISNIKSVEGNIMVAVYNATQKFLGEEMVIGKIEKVTQTGDMTIQFNDLPYGEYAISVYHDKNANQDLDTNLFKIPTEPYGFSNNAKGSFGPPNFDAAKINFNADNQQHSIRLK